MDEMPFTLECDKCGAILKGAVNIRGDIVRVKACENCLGEAREAVIDECRTALDRV